MPSQRGRDLLLKIGDGGGTEVFTTLGAARTVSIVINNALADNTVMDGGGFQSLRADAGVQAMDISLDGLFKDAAAEEALRLAAFGRTVNNYKLSFPNGDAFTGAFVVRDYHRSGSHDGLEAFSVTLARSGGGTFTAGA